MTLLWVKERLSILTAKNASVVLTAHTLTQLDKASCPLSLVPRLVCIKPTLF